jgi:hypothetical protein
VILSRRITVFVAKPIDRFAGKAASVFENTKGFLANLLEPFVDLFAWGIRERHPKLRMVMAEAGTGWLPWLVQEVDDRHWRLREGREFWADKGGAARGTSCGPRTIPIPTASGPTRGRRSSGRCVTLAPEMRRKLTRDNAAPLYGLGGSVETGGESGYVFANLGITRREGSR